MWKTGLKWLLLLVCFLIAQQSYAEIRTVDSLVEIEKEIKAAGKDDLILLDVGGTLLTHKDAVLQPYHKGWKNAWYEKNFPKLTRKEKVELSYVLQGAAQNWRLVDAKWPQVIAEAQNRGVKVVALTKTTVDPSLRGLRDAKVAANGIKLRNDLPELSDGETFIYGKGMIETEANFKGAVLKEVLGKLDKLPKKIIFVDNNRAQIESVEAVCQEVHIPCLSFEYTATKKAVPLNETIADYQLYILVTEHRWISEDQARELLKP